ncbi:MAG: DUF4886 domain-containing protein [Lishizhenia sp.]
MFQKIAASNGKKVHVEHCTTGGADWKFHVDNKSTYKYIDSKDWDYVILQARSYEPTEPREKVNSNTLPYGQKLVDYIRNKNKNTRILLFMTWGYKEGNLGHKHLNSFYKMYKVLKNEYIRFADKYKVAVAPVGEAWKNIRELYPTVNLYEKDKFHPNSFGSYINACVFYVAIFRDRFDAEKTYLPRSISALMAEKIQRVSYGTVLNPKEDWRYYNLPGPFNPTIAYEIEKGEIIFAADAPRANRISWEINGVNVSNGVFFKFPTKGLDKIKVKVRVEKDGKVYTVKQKVKF